VCQLNFPESPPSIAGKKTTTNKEPSAQPNTSVPLACRLVHDPHGPPNPLQSFHHQKKVLDLPQLHGIEQYNAGTAAGSLVHMVLHGATSTAYHHRASQSPNYPLAPNKNTVTTLTGNLAALVITNPSHFRLLAPCIFHKHIKSRNSSSQNLLASIPYHILFSLAINRPLILLRLRLLRLCRPHLGSIALDEKRHHSSNKQASHSQQNTTTPDPGVASG